MEKIIVGFSKPKSWKPFAWLIMKGYGISYDHVYIKFYSDSYDRDIIYQASSTMVNFMSPQIFIKNNEIIKQFEFNLSEETNIKLIQYCIDNAGTPYGIKEVFGLIWVRINELFGKKILNPFRDGKKTFVCCELAAIILKEFLNIEIKEDLDTINPKELYELIESVKKPEIKQL
jgi:hypothetical protein